ncbi:hypothetical protein LXL04_005360 [Taraxacum kok-saghyz]
MANASNWELEIRSSLDASTVFDEFVLKFFEFVAENVIPKELGMKFTTVEGDGGVGSIKLMSFLDDQFPSVKYKVKLIDLDNFTYKLAMIKEENGKEYESTLSEMSVLPSFDGGCTFIQKNIDFEAISEDEIEIQKEQVAQYFEVFEALVAQDFTE